MASDATIKQVLGFLSAEYPDHVNRLSPEQLRNLREVYRTILADVDDEALRAATVRHIVESQWFPKVSELRAAVARLALPPAQDPIEAWGEVERVMRSYDRNAGRPCFADPITERLVQGFGWTNLRTLDPVANRARFVEAYERLAVHAQKSAALPAYLHDGALSGGRQVNQITAGVVRRLSGGVHGTATD